MKKRILTVFFVCLRLFMAGVFLYAAWVKIRTPWQLFAMSVDAYGILPQWAVVFVARTLPWFELFIGLGLLLGKGKRFFTGVATLLLFGFFVTMVRTYLAGMQIECGCFGPGDAISPRTLARDGALLAASAALMVVALRTKPGQWKRVPVEQDD